MSADAASTATPLIFGHRGSRTVEAENTLAAIAIADVAGAYGVEIDIRPCADGELVVFHDETLERMTQQLDTRSIASLSVAELQAIDLGRGARIPTLREVLAFCRERSLALNVELKRDVPNRRQAVIAAARLLRSYHLGSELWVSSFDPIMLGGFHVLAPSLRIGLLLAHKDKVSRHLGPVARPLGAKNIHPEHTLVQGDRLTAWRAAGLRVVTWTVNEPSRIAELATMGVDAIISDDPAMAMRARDGSPEDAAREDAAPEDSGLSRS